MHYDVITITLWPILLILVCMDREDRYLSIDTKTIGGSSAKVDVLQKIAWLDDG